MEKIVGIRRSIRISELSAVTSAIIRTYKGMTIERASIKGIMDEMEASNNVLIASSHQTTQKMSVGQLDKNRDKEISTLNQILKGYCVMKNPAFNAPASSLKAVLDRYLKQKITAQGFNEETGLMMSLLGEFEKEDAKKNIEALPGVQDTIDDLKKAHEECLAYHDAKMASLSAKAPSASSIRDPLLKVINDKLVPVLNAAIIENTAELLDFASIVASEINEVNSKIASRSKAAKKSKDDKAKTDEAEANQ